MLKNHIILVGQLNQNGTIKGSTTLAHLVDTTFDIVPACPKSTRTIVVRVGIKHRYGRRGREFYTYWEHTNEGCVPCVEDDTKLDDEVWCNSHGFAVRNWAEYYRQLDEEMGYTDGGYIQQGEGFGLGRAIVRFFQGP